MQAFLSSKNKTVVADEKLVTVVSWDKTILRYFHRNGIAMETRWTSRSYILFCENNMECDTECMFWQMYFIHYIFCILYIFVHFYILYIIYSVFYLFLLWGQFWDICGHNAFALLVPWVGVWLLHVCVCERERKCACFHISATFSVWIPPTYCTSMPCYLYSFNGRILGKKNPDWNSRKHVLELFTSYRFPWKISNKQTGETVITKTETTSFTIQTTSKSSGNCQREGGAGEREGGNGGRIICAEHQTTSL